MKNDMSIYECLRNIEDVGSIITNVKFIEKNELDDHFVAEVTKQASFVGFKAVFKYIVVAIVYNRFSGGTVLQGGSVVRVYQNIEKCDYNLTNSIPEIGLYKSARPKKVLKDIEKVFGLNKFNCLDFDCEFPYFELINYKYNVEDVFS